jgi:competence protein ComEC
LLAAPVVPPATVLGVLAALVSPALPWLAEVLVRLAGPEADWLIQVGRHASRIPAAAIAWPSGWWGGLLLVACFLLLVAVLRHRRLRVLIGLALAGLLVVVVPVKVIAPGWPPQGWAMVACDVGQADATHWHCWSAAAPTAALLACGRGRPISEGAAETVG